MGFPQNLFTEICRTCLEKQQKLFNILDTKIINMFDICTTTKVSNNDGLPPNICEICLTKITNSFSFNSQCERAYEQLQEILQIKDEEIQAELIKFKQHEKVDEEISSPTLEFDIVESSENEIELPTIVDPINLVTTRRKYTRLKDILDETKCDPSELKCLICHKRFSTLSLLSRHVSRHDENRPIIGKCNICDKKFFERSQLTKHLKRHTKETRYPCECCDKMFYELSALALHMKKHKVDPLACKQCDKSFLVKLQLENHLKIHTPNIYKCNDCDKIFKHEVILKRHQLTHMTERNLKCNSCDKSFKVLSALQTHFQRVHLSNVKRVQCDKCGKSVIDIKHHLKTHNTATSSFRCGECGKLFKHKKSLVKHKALYHNGENQEKVLERLHLCHLCAHRTKSAAELLIHMNCLHSCIKEFKCEQCDKRFKTRSAQIAHQKLHSRERNYECDVCLKRFKTTTALNVHKAVHSQNKSQVCSVCGKGLRQLQALKAHMLGIHGLRIRSRRRPGATNFNEGHEYNYYIVNDK